MLLIDLAPLLQNPGSILSFEIHGCLCLPLNPNANNFVVEASTKNEDCWTETDLYKTWCCWGRAQLSIYVACSWSGLSFIMDSVLMCWKTVRYFRCCFQNFMLTISVLIFRMCHSYFVIHDVVSHGFICQGDIFAQSFVVCFIMFLLCYVLIIEIVGKKGCLLWMKIIPTLQPLKWSQQMKIYGLHHIVLHSFGVGFKITIFLLHRARRPVPLRERGEQCYSVPHWPYEPLFFCPLRYLRRAS